MVWWIVTTGVGLEAGEASDLVGVGDGLGLLGAASVPEGEGDGVGEGVGVDGASVGKSFGEFG